MSWIRPAAASLGIVVGSVALVSALGSAAANVVPSPRVGELIAPLSADDLKPPECAHLALTAVVTVEGASGGSELVLGSEGDDVYRSIGGNECVVGGAGDDVLEGGEGMNVLLGGAGDDLLAGDGGSDRLYGGPGNDVLDGGDGVDDCAGGAGTNVQVNCERE